MKNKILYVLTILTYSIYSYAQLSPQINVPSPEVAGLGQYGVIPVSLFTGIPDISIPLYEIKVGNYKFPISAGYHLASVKPNLQPGSLGMGWSLFADGYISRSVRGIYDEKCGADGIAHGYYSHAYKLKDITPSQFAEETKHIMDDGETPYYELTADEFSFSFCGYSGKFYYSENGGWHVVSDDNIRVEFNPQNDFIDLNELNKRIPVTHWLQSSWNNRFFSRFTLITPDGCRYEFGGLSAMEFSVPYYARNTSDLIPTTWRLSKITTIDKRVIEFTYDTSSILCELRYIPQSKTVYNIPCTPANPQIGKNGMTGYLIFPVNLKTITTPNEIIEFNYFREYEYPDLFVDTYLGWTHKNMYNRTDIFNNSFDDPANQFQVFLKNISTGSDYDLQQSIKSNLKHNILHSINIKNKYPGSSRTLYFDYTYNNRRKLSLITEREGSYELIPSYVWHPHGYYILVGYDIPAPKQSESPKEYHFTYNNSVCMPIDYVRPGTDSWGYYNGESISFSSIPRFGKKLPILTYTLAEVLTEITYPTGGKKHFEYELNDYSQSITPTHRLIESFGISGGLRVAKITTLDKDNQIQQIKKYTYSETTKGNKRSSGISKGTPLYKVTYILKSGEQESEESTKLELQSEGGFFPQVTNLNSPDVGYSSVIEESIDGKGESQGYIRCRFSNYDADIYGITHYDEPADYSMLSGDSYVKPFSSRSMERGKLLSKEIFDHNNRLERKITYKYKEVNPSHFLSAQQDVVFFCNDPYVPVYAMVGTLTKTYTHSYLTDSIVEIMYNDDNLPIKKEMSYTYNSKKLLKKLSSRTSEDKIRSEEYTYPSDYHNYNWMVEQNILSPIISKTIREGSSVQKEAFEYSHTNNIPYISKITIHPSSSYSRTQFIALRTDSYANPIEIEENGIRTVCIWGGEGQKLIARIDNTSYESVKEKLGKNPESFSKLKISEINYMSIENIRHQLSAAHFYIYKYTPELWLQSITEPNGVTNYYTCDELGRVIEKYYMEKIDNTYRKKILNLWDYRYYVKQTSDDTEIIK